MLGRPATPTLFFLNCWLALFLASFAFRADYLFSEMNRPRGYAFVHMLDARAADDAIKALDTTGTLAQCSFCTPHPDNFALQI